MAAFTVLMAFGAWLKTRKVGAQRFEHHASWIDSPNLQSCIEANEASGFELVTIFRDGGGLVSVRGGPAGGMYVLIWKRPK